MTVRAQWTLVVAVVALLAAGLWAATHFLGDELFPVTIGSKAPDFRARSIEATPRDRTLTDYRGSVVLLNVWATWCTPCRAEMPSIEALHERYADAGLRVVAVSIDEPGSEATITAFARELGLDFEILHDPTGDIQRIFQTTGVPETFVIGRDGVILRKQIGATDWNSSANRALVARLLGVPGDTAALPVADGRPPRDGAVVLPVPATAGASEGRR